MKNLLTRSITGVVFVSVILASLFIGPVAYLLVFATILIGAMVEFYSFYKESHYHPSGMLGYLTGLSFFVISYFVASGSLDVNFYLCVIPLFLVVFASEMYRKKEFAIENIALTILPVLYVALPIGLIHFIVYTEGKEGGFQPNLFIAVLAIIWIYDSAAYLFGVSFGKHRLFERISPKKSWEGAIGGAMVAIASSYFIQLFIPEISLIHWIILSSLIVVSATFGDLTESLVKRSVGVKDSSNFFPGHGGFLDRFDSWLFAIPVVVLYLRIFIG